MKYVVVLVGIMVFLSGCTLNQTREKRGFSYRTPLIEFTCNHEPSQTKMEISDKIAAMIPGLSNFELFGTIKTEDEENSDKRFNKKTLTIPKDLVKYCKQLIDREPIE